MKALYGQIGKLVEAGEFKEALEQLFAFVRASNKYVEDRKPWANVQADPEHAADTLYTCVQIIANLSSLLEPFVPFACAKIRGFLGIAQPSWSFFEVPAGQTLQEISILFDRIDVHRIEEENERLRSLSR